MQGLVGEFIDMFYVKSLICLLSGLPFSRKPHHIAVGIGHVVSLAPQLGTRATTNSRSESFINEANEKFLIPAGWPLASLLQTICRKSSDAVN